MSEYPVGTLVRLRSEIRGLDNVLVNPASLSLTVLAPDGTPQGPYALPGDIQTDGTGLFHYDYPLAQAGRHIARWLATTPTAVHEELFEGIAAFASVGIFSLAEAKKHLNVDEDSHDDDEEIQGFIRSVTEVCERYVGALVRTVHTQRVEGGRGIALNHFPVLSITSITAVWPGHVPPALADLHIDETTGVIQRKDGDRICGPLIVIYVAARTAIPSHVRLAGKILLQHLWETQRGQQGGASFGGSQEPWDPRFSFAIPRRVLELLGDPVSGLA